MTDDQLLDILGLRLVRDVRDRVIDGIDGAVIGKYGHVYARDLKQQHEALDESAQAFIRDLTPYIVDDVLVTLLQVLDAELIKPNEQRELQLTVSDAAGQWINVSELSDGLEAEYAGQGGWIDRFSGQRLGGVTERVEKKIGLRVEVPDSTSGAD